MVSASAHEEWLGAMVRLGRGEGGGLEALGCAPAPCYVRLGDESRSCRGDGLDLEVLGCASAPCYVGRGDGLGLAVAAAGLAVVRPCWSRWLVRKRRKLLGKEESLL